MNDALGIGRAALAEAAWEKAREAFETSLGEGETAEGHDGRGLALWWLGHVREALAERERAHVMYLDRGDARHAAAMALWISAEQASAFGEQAVPNGWFQRAERLLAGDKPCPERVALLLERAQRLDDVDGAQKTYEEAARRG